MNANSSRRKFIATAGAAALAATATPTIAARASASATPLKLLGVACSPRKGMTTAKAVQAALHAAKAFSPRIEVEMIDLGGLSIAGWSPNIPRDDFDALLPKLRDPQLGGLILGSPSYFRSLRPPEPSAGSRQAGGTEVNRSPVVGPSRARAAPSLTPALAPRRGRPGFSKGARLARWLGRRLNPVLPLLAGEGWGEGDRLHQPRRRR